MHNMFLRDVDRIIVVCVMLSLGLFLVSFATVRGHDFLIFVPLGIFACLMGCWILGTTQVKQILWDSPLVWKYVELTSIYLVPAAIVEFLRRSIRHATRRWLLVLFWIHVFFAVAAIVLSLAGFVRLPRTIAPFNLLLLITIVVFLVMLVFWVRVGDESARAFVYGILVLVLFAVHDILANLLLIPWQRSVSHWGALAFTINLSLLLIRRVQATRRLLHEYSLEMDLARSMQKALLPRPAISCPRLRVYAHYEPARDVGGDYYAFGPNDERSLGILVADVTGHGLSASLIAGMVQTAFIAARQRGTGPGRTLESMNHILFGNAAGQVSTALLVQIDVKHRHATLACAGHPPAILLRQGRLTEIHARGPALGWRPRIRPNEVRFAYKEGDRMILYTDGLVEARNPAGQIFGFEKLLSLVQKYGAAPAPDLVEALLAALKRFCLDDSLEDDATLLVVDFLPDRV